MRLDAETYRDIWGNFATGVTVITTDVDGQLHGMTANGVTSVSLDPLLMLVCVDRDARCYVQLMAAHSFGVSFLGRDQEDLSNLFAKGGDPEDGQLRGATFRKGSAGEVLLQGAIATLECKVSEVLRAGDHDIFIGEAVSGEVHDSNAAPLLFFRGGYYRM